MGKRGHTEEEILGVLREAEAGATVVEVCRKHGIISQQSFYLWNGDLIRRLQQSPAALSLGRSHAG